MVRSSTSAETRNRVGLMVVDGEVFQAGADTLALNAVDHRDAEDTRHQRVFGEVGWAGRRVFTVSLKWIVLGIFLILGLWSDAPAPLVLRPFLIVPECDERCLHIGLPR